MDTEDRWYVRFRGHTLGPLTSEQVKSSVRRKELGPDDKLASTSNPAWRALRTEGDFLRCWEAITRPIPAELAPLPSPRILWQKKRAPLPVAVAPLAAVHAPSVTKPVATTPSAPTSAPVAKAKAKPKKASKRPAKAKAERKIKPSAALAIPEKPELMPVTVASPATEPAPAALPIVAVAPPAAELAPPAADPVLPVAELIPAATPAPAPAPKLAEETLSLLEALREWNRKEKENAPKPQAIAVAKPELAFAPLPEKAPVFSRPEITEAPAAPAEKRGIELRLNLVISKQFIFISALVAALALAAVVYTVTEAKKMRGPADSRLPDPSSPTIEPSPKNDPIPQLKAPTRPKRD